MLAYKNIFSVILMGWLIKNGFQPLFSDIIYAL
jgi:hypothetical protein